MKYYRYWQINFTVPGWDCGFVPRLFVPIRCSTREVVGFHGLEPCHQWVISYGRHMEFRRKLSRTEPLVPGQRIEIASLAPGGALVADEIVEQGDLSGDLSHVERGIAERVASPIHVERVEGVEGNYAAIARCIQVDTAKEYCDLALTLMLAYNFDGST